MIFITSLMLLLSIYGCQSVTMDLTSNEVVVGPLAEDLPQDLVWLRTLSEDKKKLSPTNEAFENQRLEVQQTSNVGSYLPGISDIGSSSDPVMIPSTDGKLLLLKGNSLKQSPIPKGFRRLDDSDELVHSASRNTRNRQNVRGSGNFKGEQTINRNLKDQGDRLRMKGNRNIIKRRMMNVGREGRKQKPFNGKSPSEMIFRENGAQGPRSSNRRRDETSRARQHKHQKQHLDQKIYNQMKRKMTSESRKKISRPLAMNRAMNELGNRDESTEKVDPFFNDEEADKRTDQDQDDADEDEARDDVEIGSRSQEPSSKRLRRVSNSKVRDQFRSSMRDDESNSMEDGSNGSSDEGDDDVDSSNLNQKRSLVGASALESEVPLANQSVQRSMDLATAAGHHHGHHHGHYYQHVEVPKKKAWKFGFKRGNHKHESKFIIGFYS